MNLILQSLTFEKNAELELAYNIMDELAQHMGDCIYDEAVIRAANETVAFGNYLYEQFKALSMYRNGYLFYQFHQWLGPDLVLRRLSL